MTTIRLSISEMALSLLLQLFVFCSIPCKSFEMNFSLIYALYISIIVFFSLDLSKSQGQYYEVKPSDVSALIGTNVTIACVIAPPHGDVQWTKDGLALGKIYFKSCIYTFFIIIYDKHPLPTFFLTLPIDKCSNDSLTPPYLIMISDTNPSISNK